MSRSLVQVTDSGLYCPGGDFYIDPWRRVERAVTTHAHSDHARPGSRRYLTAAAGVGVLRQRLGPKAQIDGFPYGQSLTLGTTRVSLHPAGHLLGSSQVRIEQDGYVTVVSGDYKTAADPTCAPLEPLRCHEFISECTFGLPVYRWPPAESVIAEINAWWRDNQREQCVSVIFAYALGKAQRILASVDGTIGPIYVHHAIEALLPAYRAAGVDLPPATRPEAARLRAQRGQALVIAPPATSASRWLAKLGAAATASASGWMALRGPRRRQALDRGFVLSDHADWDGLLATIRATGATRVGMTHGYTAPMVRYLRELGYDAYALATRFEGELADDAELDAPNEASAAGYASAASDAQVATEDEPLLPQPPVKRD